MAMKLIEAAIDFLKTYIEANLVAKLDELNAEYRDFELVDIQNYYVAELLEIPEYPSIIILGDSSVPVGEGGGWIRTQHSISLTCLVTDAETERLRRRLYRYVRALFELLSEVQGTTTDYIINVDRLDFAPVYTRGGQFLSDAHLLITMGSYETF